MIDSESLFFEALALPPEERRAFLEQATDGDSEELSLLLNMVWVHENDFDPLEGGEIAIDPLQIGPYPILGRIGEGGMGVVYLSVHPTLKVPLAIKVLAPDLARDPGRIARFHKEARLVATVNHPHVATIHDFGENEGNHFVSMEYIEGPTLAEELHRGPLGADASLDLLIQIAQGLVAAHGQEIIHRDLKPQNVLIHPSNGAKIVDFGIATSLGDIETLTAETRPGPATSTIGTPEYASPEQIRRERVDARTDIWSFGCVAYECLTGERAFPRAGSATTPGPDLSRFPTDVPPTLRALIQKCLQRDRTDRWASMKDLQEELERIRERRRHPRSSRPMILIVTTVLVLLLVAVVLSQVGVLFPRQGEPRRLSAVLLEDTKMLRGVDPEGEEIWNREMPGTVRENENHSYLGESRKDLPFLIVDTGKGPEGVIVAVEPAGSPAQLHNLDPARGTDVWIRPLTWIRGRNRTEVSQPVSVWQRQIEVPGSTPGNGKEPALLIAVRNGSWYQESMQRLTLDGITQAAYYHPGHLQFAGQFTFGDSLDQVLLFVGDNSSARLVREFVPFTTDRHCGAVVLLDPNRMDGQAYPYAPEELERDWPDLPPADEIGYLLIPPIHPDVDAAIESFEVNPEVGTISVRTLDGRMYHADARLRPTSVFVPTDCPAQDLIESGDAVQLPVIYIRGGEASFVDVPYR